MGLELSAAQEQWVRSIQQAPKLSLLHHAWDNPPGGSREGGGTMETPDVMTSACDLGFHIIYYSLMLNVEALHGQLSGP